MRYRIVGMLLLFCGVLGALQQLPAEEVAEDLLLGGQATVFEKNSQAFSLPFPKLGGIERLQFQAGDALFTEAWVAAPASTAGRDGLGPLHITRACANCHLKDGRGAPPVDAQDEPTGLLVRLSSQEAHAYGDQIQNRAIPGAKPEASIQISWLERSVDLADGTKVSLRAPQLQLENLAYGPLPKDVLTSLRLAPPVHGLGLLEAVSPETILESADMDDHNQDGISGTPNYVFSQATQQTEIGRFGWKANQATLHDQDAGAFNGDMGLTTSLAPLENCSSLQTVWTDVPNGGHPEVEDKQFNLVVHYSRFIAVPARRDTDRPEVQAGRKLFFEAGCAACHRPTMTTRTDAAHRLLAQQKIWPYTDLLLHDMGPDLADHRPDGLANGREWRTPPLWGIGLTQEVNNRPFYLHDGRARTLEEAILWHGGEADGSREAYRTMPAEQRAQLLRFLKSL
ncbi:MAG TPA: di-heme oxidoredictase family protein [Oligoflexus sp.]|uniref:di-heme oxidoreductase family protein n=1 Tax=Oligoflexus sp. TaxID=1971216 RepID=UPI002D611FFC|nr:di-heme oxidoredictase family protein [Oligoflexus sp.]HYX35385.1 di-heme oxidoredictase family protein [Oligoflexus sp.]